MVRLAWCSLFAVVSSGVASVSYRSAFILSVRARRARLGSIRRFRHPRRSHVARVALSIISHLLSSGISGPSCGPALPFLGCSSTSGYSLWSWASACCRHLLYRHPLARASTVVGILPGICAFAGICTIAGICTCRHRPRREVLERSSALLLTFLSRLPSSSHCSASYSSALY